VYAVVWLPIGTSTLYCYGLVLLYLHSLQWQDFLFTCCYGSFCRKPQRSTKELEMRGEDVTLSGIKDFFVEEFENVKRSFRKK